MFMHSSQGLASHVAGFTVEQLDAGSQWALQQRKEGRTVYVHCAYGHGRSCTMLCACLTAAGVFPNFVAAFRHIQEVRPRVCPPTPCSTSPHPWSRRQVLDLKHRTCRCTSMRGRSNRCWSGPNNEGMSFQRILPPCRERNRQSWNEWGHQLFSTKFDPSFSLFSLLIRLLAMPLNC